jgi:DNA-binding CsgD family transcriptional regulator
VSSFCQRLPRRFPYNIVATPEKDTEDTAGVCKKLAMDKCLSGREMEVLCILAGGHSLTRVENGLFISKGTAITHRRHIYRKLGAQ